MNNLSAAGGLFSASANDVFGIIRDEQKPCSANDQVDGGWRKPCLSDSCAKKTTAQFNQESSRNPGAKRRNRTFTFTVWPPVFTDHFSLRFTSPPPTHTRGLIALAARQLVAALLSYWTSSWTIVPTLASDAAIRAFATRSGVQIEPWLVDGAGATELERCEGRWRPAVRAIVGGGCAGLVPSMEESLAAFVRHIMPMERAQKTRRKYATQVLTWAVWKAHEHRSFH